MDATNPRAVTGSNEAPDYAQSVTDAMRRDYAEVEKTVGDLLEEARALPTEVADDATMGTYAKLIKRLRDVAGRVEAFRIKEKEPYLRGGNAVDGFFNSLFAKVSRRARGDKPGAADVLQARLDDYQQRKLREEQERRRREAAEQERLAREAQAQADLERRQAEEARLAADRARKPETVIAKEAVADAQEATAFTAGIEAKLAEGRAEDAHIATLAKPADLVRTRVADALVTMAQEAYAEVVDRVLLDKAALWPFFTDQEIEKALRGWAKTTGHRKPMEGAAIGKRAKSVIR